MESIRYVLPDRMYQAPASAKTMAAKHPAATHSLRRLSFLSGGTSATTTLADSV